MEKVRLAILASGNGSNAEAIMRWAKASTFAEVVCVLSDKRDALVLRRAFDLNVPAFSVLKRKNEERAEFDQRMVMRLADYNPDWIVLAGFMKLLSKSFLEKFDGKVVNIHPSLLPLFPGKNGHAETFASDVKEGGCTIHYVDEGIDTGKIIAQAKFSKIAGEDFLEFKKRGLALENKFYPEVLEQLLKNKGIV